MALAPQMMVPLRRSKGTDASHRLSRIEWLEIAGIDQIEGKTYYIIHIFTSTSSTQSRIPTSPSNRDHVTNGLAKPTRTVPDYRVRRRMSEFEQLRANLMLAVQSPHKRLCRFCDGLQSHFLCSATRWAMGVRALLVSTDLRTRVLNKLLREVLTEYQSKRLLVDARRPCTGAEEVSCMIHEFLFGSEQLSVLERTS